MTTINSGQELTLSERIEHIKSAIYEKWDGGAIKLIQTIGRSALVHVRKDILVEDHTWYWQRDGTVSHMKGAIMELLDCYFYRVEHLKTFIDSKHDCVEVYAIVSWDGRSSTMREGLLLRAIYVAQVLGIIEVSEAADILDAYVRGGWFI